VRRGKDWLMIGGGRKGGRAGREGRGGGRGEREKEGEDPMGWGGADLSSLTHFKSHSFQVGLTHFEHVSLVAAHWSH
jgi:hypothetical protein